MNESKFARNVGQGISLFRRIAMTGALLVFLGAYGGESNADITPVYPAVGTSFATCKQITDPNIPVRLRIRGRLLIGPKCGEVTLQGVNLRDNILRDEDTGELIGYAPIVTTAEVNDLVDNLHMNFVRLRISNVSANRDRRHPSRLSDQARADIDNAIRLLSARKIWILLEMRTGDESSKSLAFYTPGTDDFNSYRDTWVWLAQTYSKADSPNKAHFIAGYGLLAEPSTDKIKKDLDGKPFTGDPVSTLIAFQYALIEAISAEDKVTPFFVGPAFNYDTMGYRWNQYYTALPCYTKLPSCTPPTEAPNIARLVYEVNMLSPKDWIAQGVVPSGEMSKWPYSSLAQDFNGPLLAPVDGLDPDIDQEETFKINSDNPDNFDLLMNSNYPAWYLDFAAKFSDPDPLSRPDLRQVPMIVDQFGATTLANTANRPRQQLAYERAVILAAKAKGMGWSRWIYAADPPPGVAGKPDCRSIVGNSCVNKFYKQIGAGVPPADIDLQALCPTEPPPYLIPTWCEPEPPAN